MCDKKEKEGWKNLVTKKRVFWTSCGLVAVMLFPAPAVILLGTGFLWLYGGFLAGCGVMLIVGTFFSCAAAYYKAREEYKKLSESEPEMEFCLAFWCRVSFHTCFVVHWPIKTRYEPFYCFVLYCDDDDKTTWRFDDTKETQKRLLRSICC